MKVNLSGMFLAIRIKFLEASMHSFPFEELLERRILILLHKNISGARADGVRVIKLVPGYNAGKFAENNKKFSVQLG